MILFKKVKIAIEKQHYGLNIASLLLNSLYYRGCMNLECPTTSVKSLLLAVVSFPATTVSMEKAFKASVIDMVPSAELLRVKDITYI
jgi:hypothetical protein